MFEQSKKAGLEPFDVMGMGAEGHRNPRYVVRLEDFAKMILRKANIPTIKINGGVDALWAEDVERYLKQSSP